MEFSALCCDYWLSKVCKVQCPDLAQVCLIACVPDATENSLKSINLASTLLGKNELKCFILNWKD